MQAHYASPGMCVQREGRNVDGGECTERDVTKGPHTVHSTEDENVVYNLCVLGGGLVESWQKLPFFGKWRVHIIYPMTNMLSPSNLGYHQSTSYSAF